jgi:hypothetical protein
MASHSFFQHLRGASAHPRSRIPPMALACSLAVCLLSLVVVLPQDGFTEEGVEASKDLEGLRIAEQALSAMGSSTAWVAYRDSVANGTVTIAAAGSTPFPIVLKSKGTGMLRVELQKPDGTNVLVLNDGEGVILNPSGKLRRLQLYNTLARRVDHIPAFSLLAESGAPGVQVSSPLAAQIEDRAAEAIELSLVTPERGPADLVREVTRTQFYVDRMTRMITKMEYTNYAENDSNAKQRVEVFFSDYRMVAGVWVPFRQTTLTDGVLDSELVLASVAFDVGLSEAEFLLPE